VGFIAIFGSQLEDNFFEHSLEDLMVGAGGLLKLKPVPFKTMPVESGFGFSLFCESNSGNVSGRRFYCSIRLLA
jgi:hypothetical protein